MHVRGKLTGRVIGWLRAVHDDNNNGIDSGLCAGKDNVDSWKVFVMEEVTESRGKKARALNNKPSR